MLSGRDYTEGILKEKLIQKGYTQVEVSEVISSLAQSDLINDERFAQLYFENLKKYKQMGYYGVKQKLMLKKIPSSIITNVLAEYGEKEEKAVAKEYVRKHSKKTEDQLMRGLQGRGFRSDVIFSVLKRTTH